MVTIFRHSMIVVLPDPFLPTIRVSGLKNWRAQWGSYAPSARASFQSALPAVGCSRRVQRAAVAAHLDHLRVVW